MGGDEMNITKKLHNLYFGIEKTNPVDIDIQSVLLEMIACSYIEAQTLKKLEAKIQRLEKKQSRKKETKK